MDGMARVDGAVAAAAADAMPALAITDAGNLFGAVKFFLAARARRRAADHRLRPRDHQRKEPRPARRAWSCCAATRPATSRSARFSRAPTQTNQWRGRAEVRREWLKGVRGLIVLSGAESGDIGAALLAGGDGAGRGAGARVGRGFPRRVLRRTAARRPGAQRPLCARRGRARRPARAAGRRHAPGAVRARGGIHRPRGPRLHRAGLGARGPAPPARVQAVAVLQDAGGDGGALRGPSRGARELGRDRAALRLRVLARQDAAAGFPDARRA